MNQLWPVLHQIIRELRVNRREGAAIKLRVEILEDASDELTETTEQLAQASNEEKDRFDQEVERLQVEIDLIRRHRRRGTAS